MEHLVEHFAMLAGRADDAFDLARPAREGVNDRGHLDGFGASADDGEDGEHSQAYHVGRPSLAVPHCRKIVNSHFRTAKEGRPTVILATMLTTPSLNASS